MKTLSILVPAYNEERTLPRILEKLESVALGDGVGKEVVVVDDGSRDRTWEVMQAWATKPWLKTYRHEKNRGKGAAIQTAIARATGDWVVIQDADLEYDPADLPALIRRLAETGSAAVYGSRNLSANPRYSRIFYFGNMFLNAMTFLLYGRWVSDMETCYKMIRRDVLVSLNLRAGKFDMEPEITGKLLRLGHRIEEVPISYSPRSREEGKKITWVDGVSALWTLVRWRFTPKSRICPAGPS